MRHALGTALAAGLATLATVTLTHAGWIAGVCLPVARF